MVKKMGEKKFSKKYSIVATKKVAKIKKDIGDLIASSPYINNTKKDLMIKQMGFIEVQ
jgi:hypothetical protein